MFDLSNAEAVQAKIHFLQALNISLCELNDVFEESFEYLKSGGVIGQVYVYLFLEFAARPHQLGEISISVVAGYHYNFFPDNFIELA